MSSELQAKPRPEHFFKYVSCGTAKIVLRDSTLRWSSPIQLNDPFDLQFDMHVEYKRDELISSVLAELWLFFSKQKPFVSKNRWGEAIKTLSDMAPKLTEDDFKSSLRKGLEESLATQESSLPKLHRHLRDQLKNAQILCLSETPSNILMWSHYAHNHTGAVLRLSYIEELASPWGAAQQVQYRENMPLLFDHSELFLFLTGQVAINQKRIFEESAVVKAIDWSYEREWRVIYYGDKETPYEDTPFDPSQVTAIYLGYRMSAKDREEVTELATKANPTVEIYSADKSNRRFGIEFVRLA